MNAQNDGKAGAFSQVKETAFVARGLVRAALKGALATVHKGLGHPYASLVLVATDTDGSPILLISKLALHTQNLAADPRASLLIDATGTEASPQEDPMQGARLTLIGEVHPASSTTARARFLARHPTAAGYADFPDFGFFALRPERAHFIGGFGRIVDLPVEDLLISTEGAEGLITAEPDIVSHMNADHADAIALYATKLLGAECLTHVSGMTGAWRMTGIDAEGCDLVLGARALRLPFGSRVATAAEARTELVRLAAAARAA
jgi:heme oxygenase (biliverdin-IX-beta and delta-forming)